MSKSMLGHPVECTFLDHVEDGDEPIEFIVYGRLVKATRKHYVIASWCYKDASEPTDSNEKVWSIVKSAVTKMRQLK